MRESHIRVRVVYMQRVVSMLEPLACRQSSVGGLICMQGAICVWAVTMFWVEELSLGRRQSVRRPSLSRENASKVDRSEDREGWLGSQKAPNSSWGRRKERVAFKCWGRLLNATSWRPARLWMAIYVPAGYRVVFSDFAGVEMLLGCSLG